MIAELQKQIAEKAKEIDTLNQIIADRDLEIESLKLNQEQHVLKTFIANKDAKYYIRLKKDEVLNYEIKD